MIYYEIDVIYFKIDKKKICNIITSSPNASSYSCSLAFNGLILKTCSIHDKCRVYCIFHIVNMTRVFGVLILNERT